MLNDKLRAIRMKNHINRHPNQFDTATVPTQNLLRAVGNRARHPPRTERNYDWSMTWRTKSERRGNMKTYHIATWEFDDNPDIPDDVVLLDELNRLVGYNGYPLEEKWCGRYSHTKKQIQHLVKQKEWEYWKFGSNYLQ
jgi:hypothetical protein